MFKLVLALSLVLYSANAAIPAGADEVCSRKVGQQSARAAGCPSYPNETPQPVCCEETPPPNVEGCQPVDCPATAPPTTTTTTTTKAPTTSTTTTSTTETTTCYCDDTVTQCANNRRRLSKLERAANRRQLLGKKKGASKGGKKSGKKSGGSGLLGCGQCDCDKTTGPNGNKIGMVSMTLRWAGTEDVTITVSEARRRRLGKNNGGGGAGAVTCELEKRNNGGKVLSTGEEGDCRAVSSYATNSLITVTAVGGGVVCTSDIHTSCSQDIVGSAHCVDTAGNTRLVVSGWADGLDDTNYCDDGWKPCPCSDATAQSAQATNNALGALAMNFGDEEVEDKASDFDKYGVPIIIVVAIVVLIALGVGMFVLWKRRNAGKATFESGQVPEEEVEMEMDMEVDVETKNITQ